MNEIVLVEKPISLDCLKEVAKERFGDLVKAIVDIRLEIMAIGASKQACMQTKRNFYWSRARYKMICGV